MITPLVHLTLPDLETNSVEAHFAPLVFLLEGLIKVNEFHFNRAKKLAAIGRGAPFPKLYDTGIYYEEDKPGREDWRDAPAILDRFFRTGRGADCDQLLCWRVAEQRSDGIPCEPVIKWQHLTKQIASAIYPANMIPDEGLWLVHCCVRYGNGTIEDISKILGMGGSFTRSI